MDRPPTTGRALYCPTPLPYSPVLAWQEELVRARLAGSIPDTLLLLQHTPVITLGRRGRREHLLASDDLLARAGIELSAAPRGGDITWHGPGQLVAYPIVQLSRGAGAHGHLDALQTAAIATARAFGVDARHDPRMSGAWCDGGKLAAIGFKVTRGVASHGLALNVNPDLAAFTLIHGCGLVGQPVTSLAEALGERSCPSMEEVARRMAFELGRTLGVEWDFTEETPSLSSRIPGTPG